ncbi:MAG TPA: acyl carrier protein [Terriglobales bacterium]|nr:acyl carrier protein [Terriglobales bacterium]
MSTFDEVRNMASDIFGVPAAALTADSSPDSVEPWDSVQHLNLVLAIEEKFGVQLDPEEIEQMKTLGATAKLIDSKLQARSQ